MDTNTPSKSTIISLLESWINQRAGLDPRDYISGWNDTAGRSAYRSEQRSITQDKHDAERLLRSVSSLDSITAADLMEATRAYSGRLQIKQKDNGSWEIEYCTGQYFPTEYRAAVCAVLASALWNDSRKDVPEEVENKGEYLRKSFVRWFGRSIARRWFN